MRRPLGAQALACRGNVVSPRRQVEACTPRGRLGRLMGCCLLSLGLAAAEPAMSLYWDQATVRAAATATAPTSAWVDDPAVIALRAFCVASAAADPTAPDLAAAWDQWGEVRATAAPGGIAAWSLAGLTDTAWLAARSGRTPHLMDGVATLAAVGAPPPVTPGRDPIALSLDLTALRRLDPARLAQLDRVLVGWRDAKARLEVAVAAQDGVWSGRASGPLTALRPLTPAFCAAIPAAPVRLALNLPPPLLANTVSALAGPHQAFINEVLGGDLGAVARLFTGDIALTLTPALPRPQVLIVLGSIPGAELGPVVGNLGDVFRGRGAVVPGAIGAWSWDTPLGSMQAALVPGRLVVGTDPVAVAAALAGDGAPWSLPAGAVADLQAEPAGVMALLPFASLVLPHPALVSDPLERALRELAAAVDPLLATGAVDWGPLLADQLAHHHPAPGLDMRLAAVFGSALPERLAAACAVYTAARQPPVVVARRATGWWAVQGAESGGSFTESRLAGLLAAYQRRLGPELAQLVVLDVAEPPRLELTLLPMTGLAALPGPWTASLVHAGEGATLTETGLPLGSLFLGWTGLSLWHEASARPAATADL